MSSQPKPKKTGTQYEVAFNESGAMSRVPVTAPQGLQLQQLPPNLPRPAITSTAINASVQQPINSRPAEEVEEELFFNNEGPLTGEAKEKAVAEAKAKASQENDEEELVFNNEGQLTGEAREKALAETRALQAPAQPQPRKPGKNEKTFAELQGTERMKYVYRLRAKAPRFYTYTDEGNLRIEPNNPANLPPATIPLRAFSELRPEELEEIERAQEEKMRDIEALYDAKLLELREAYDNYVDYLEDTHLAVVKLNEELRELSVTRNKTMYPERWTRVISNPETRSILLSETYEERKLGYDVFAFKRYYLSKQDALGHYREHGEAKMEGMSGGGTVVLFLTNPDDETTGSFHPATEREFVHNETKYSSPYQAFQTERFKEMENEGMVKKLLGTRSAKTIRELVSKEPQQAANPQKLWEEILETFYTQFKDAADKLKATGSARFHNMDKLLGSVEYANALANVRTKLKERENDAPSSAGPAKMSVITEDEQKKAKVGAIINNFRRG